ncbi:hypothetical protein V6N12_050140 [Hibiscus sabdariffa]|uniref:Uncharacterized protein n=1 Tax=Hibiscus sabdariffa TaxID=183260 RepID=A0ABR2GBJ0_9ROSI
MCSGELGSNSSSGMGLTLSGQPPNGGEFTMVVNPVESGGDSVHGETAMGRSENAPLLDGVAAKPYFQDMVAGQYGANQKDNFIGDFDVDLVQKSSNEGYGPWMQVEQQRRSPMPSSKLESIALVPKPLTSGS